MVGIQLPQDVPLDIRFSLDGPNGCKIVLTVAIAEWPEGYGFPRLLEYPGLMAPLISTTACPVVFGSVRACAWIHDDTLVCIPWKI